MSPVVVRDRVPAPDRAPAKRDVTRRRILDSARRVFVSVGYGGATYPAIGSGAGVSPTAVRHHYRSMPHLFGAVRDADRCAVLAAVADAAERPTEAGRCASLVERLVDDAELRASAAFLLIAQQESRRRPDLHRSAPPGFPSLDAGRDPRPDTAARVDDVLGALVCGVALFGDAVAPGSVAALIHDGLGARGA